MDMTELKQAAADAADENGMVAVEAIIDGVRDNGHKYRAGDTLHMHRDLVGPHAAAGQVKIVAGSPDKQATPTVVK